MKKIKQFLASVAVGLGLSSPVLAEGTTDFSTTATTMGTDLAGAFTTMATNISPIIKTVFVAALGIWVLFVVVRLLQKGWSKISGR